MSFKIVNANFKPYINGPKSSVLRAIASFGTDSLDGSKIVSIFPSRDAIAKRASVSMRTAHKYINEWKKDNVLTAVGKKVKGVIVYCLDVAEMNKHLEPESILKIKPKKIIKQSESTQQASCSPVNTIAEQASYSPVKEVHSASCSPVKEVHTNSLYDFNNLKKEDDFLSKLKVACEESQKVDPSDGHSVGFTEQLVKDIQEFVSNPPDYIHSEKHAQNVILKQIREGKYVPPVCKTKEKLQNNIKEAIRFGRECNARGQYYVIEPHLSYLGESLTKAGIHFLISRERSSEDYHVWQNGYENSGSRYAHLF